MSDAPVPGPTTTPRVTPWWRTDRVPNLRPRPARRPLRARIRTGSSVFRAALRPGVLLASAVLLANAPDLDFLPGLLVGTPGAYHRGPSHTLLAVVVVGLAIALVARWRAAPRPWRLGLWAAAAYGSHLVVDFLTIDAVPPFGGRFLWPLSDAYYIAPVTPIPELIVDMSGRQAFFASLLDAHAMGRWLGEATGLVAPFG